MKFFNVENMTEKEYNLNVRTVLISTIQLTFGICTTTCFFFELASSTIAASGSIKQAAIHDALGDSHWLSWTNK